MTMKYRKQCKTYFLEIIMQKYFTQTCVFQLGTFQKKFRQLKRKHSLHEYVKCVLKKLKKKLASLEERKRPGGVKIAKWLFVYQFALKFTTLM